MFDLTKKLIILAIILFLAWGFIGGTQAQSIGVTCDMGIGEYFCLKWHTNTLGQIGEFLEDTGNTIKDSIE